MPKKLVFIFIGVAILVFLGYNYIYREHRNIAEEETKYILEAGTLVNDFKENQEKASEKYLNKTITVKGRVTELNPDNITLENKVFCTFNERSEGIELNEKTSIKGRCIGYDDLLEQVKLDQCSLIK